MNGDTLIEFDDLPRIDKSVIQAVLEALQRGGDGILQVNSLRLDLPAASVDLAGLRTLLNLLCRQHPRQFALILPLVKDGDLAGDDCGDEIAQRRLSIRAGGQRHLWLPAGKKRFALAKDLGLDTDPKLCIQRSILLSRYSDDDFSLRLVDTLARDQSLPSTHSMKVSKVITSVRDLRGCPEYTMHTPSSLKRSHFSTHHSVPV
jgi:hypothetical protein